MSSKSAGSSVTTFISIEIWRREVEAAAVLGVEAASKGFSAVIVDQVLIHMAFRFLRRLGLLQNFPGLYHAKSVSPTKERIRLYRSLKEKGILVTAHDQEHGLLQRSYEEFARKRFSAETVTSISRYFCWGQFDEEFLKKQFPDFEERFVMTGSPRVDSWSQTVAPWSLRKVEAPDKPYILFSSHFRFERGGQVDFLKDNATAGGQGWNDALSRLTQSEGQLSLLMGWLDLIPRILSGYSKMPIIFRPHPTEDPSVWAKLLIPHPALTISSDGPIGPWVQGAGVVIHSGCTTAVEASLRGKPVISFIPAGLSDEVTPPIPSSIGTRCSAAREVLRVVSSLSNGEIDNSSVGTPHEVRRRFFFGPSGALGSTAIADEWRKICQSNDVKALKPQQNRARLFAILALGYALKTFSRHGLTRNWKVEPIQRQDVDQVVELARRLGREVKVRKVGPLALVIRPSFRKD